MKKSDDVGTFHGLACLIIFNIENLIDSTMYTAVAIDTCQDISLKNTIKKTHQKGKWKKVSVEYSISNKAEIEKLSMEKILWAKGILTL